MPATVHKAKACYVSLGARNSGALALHGRTMFQKPKLPPSNALLAALSAQQRERLLRDSELLDVPLGYVLVEPGQPMEHVYFPETALVSLLCVLPDRSAVETAIVGREGMAPMAVFHGVTRTPEQVIVQHAGTLTRVTTLRFSAFVLESPSLALTLNRYAQALYTFAAQSSACNRMHSVTQRCARWLLATHDRVAEDEFPVTHLYLSQMVGVRRSSVTVAAEALRVEGAIAYGRGTIRIVDRSKLLAAACDCYGVVRQAYDLLAVGTPAFVEAPPEVIKEAAREVKLDLVGTPDAASDSKPLENTNLSVAATIRAAIDHLSRLETRLQNKSEKKQVKRKRKKSR